MMRTTSPPETFSPISGIRTSVGMLGSRSCRVFLACIDFQIGNRLRGHRRIDLAVAPERLERGQRDVLRVNLEEIAQCAPVFAAAEAVSAERGHGQRHPA